MSITEQIVAKVKKLPPDKQRKVLNFAEQLRAEINSKDEARSFAEAGLSLAARVWPQEDFSDWPGYNKKAADGSNSAG